MTSRMEFTPEEWSAVAEAPLMAAARVVAAERGGTVRENLAIRRVYAAARELRGESALLDDLVASSPPADLKAMLGGDRPPDDGNARLQAALAILKVKAAPEDADAYKGFVLAV